MTDDQKLMLFGNWLLKQSYPKLYIKSGVDNSYIRMPMKDILKIYKKENGL